MRSTFANFSTEFTACWVRESCVGGSSHIGMAQGICIWVTFSLALVWPQTDRKFKQYTIGQSQLMLNSSASASWDWHAYYRHYISNFASIASPLHHLTQKGVSFSWTLECQQAFCSLKEKLVQAYPPFDSNADLFTLQLPDGPRGCRANGAVLEQGGHLIAYASRLLTKAAWKAV